jgi:glycosyltransferase involved in cell wall biosynthesis
MKICFFSPTAYVYFNPDSNMWAGGAETQQVFIAREMAKRGIDVSFIVGDYGQPDAEIVGGITLIKSFEPFKGNRKLRFIPDMIKIKRAMRIADADIYNQRSTSFFTGQLAYFASQIGRIFTFSIGIDYNCYPDCLGRLPWPLTLLYRYGLNRADGIIAQTEKQQHLLKKNFGIEAVLIRNGVPIPDPDAEIHRLVDKEPAGEEATIDGKDGGCDLLWVGSLRRRKRPDLYLELARRTPNAKFTMIGGKGDDENYHREIYSLAKSISNVRHIGFVPPDEMNKYYGSAYALVNTSDLEGFPNTYLHSWAHGVPTFTIEIDPDEIIEKNGIGKATGTFEGLVSEIHSICDNPQTRSEMSARALSYVRQNHDIRDRCDDYMRFFEDLLQRAESSSSRRSG